ncbi:MAG: hypothetical protein KDB58_14285 [Solirubrobacterales bacterium]|nr:hypothetical protein [Solirubrobacterales bacterium]MCB8971556.1 hypothetical protein [Thermoleophilales bacterium]MCO5327057.1 hypothetical protein [Solirubrobacterales bacterium]
MSLGEAIRTERLLLRGWRDSDRDPFAAMNFEHPLIEPGHELRPHVLYRLAAPIAAN